MLNIFYETHPEMIPKELEGRKAETKVWNPIPLIPNTHCMVPNTWFHPLMPYIHHGLWEGLMAMNGKRLILTQDCAKPTSFQFRGDTNCQNIYRYLGQPPQIYSREFSIRGWHWMRPCSSAHKCPTLRTCLAICSLVHAHWKIQENMKATFPLE